MGGMEAAGGDSRCEQLLGQWTVAVGSGCVGAIENLERFGVAALAHERAGEGQRQSDALGAAWRERQRLTEPVHGLRPPIGRLGLREVGE